MDGVLWTLLLNGALALGSWRIARNAFGQPRGLPRLLATAVIFMTWLILGVEILGAFGVMGRWTFLGWTTVLVVAAFIHRRESVEADPAVEPVSFEWEAVVALGLTLWMTAIFGATSLFLPVKVVSDGPIYHLYFAARWWKSGSIDMIASPFGENAATYFPAVGDYWFTWLMSCWNGDRLAKIGQSPFLLLAGLATFDLARRLCANASAALVATTWFVTVSPFFMFTFEPNVDTIFIAFYLVAVNFWIRHIDGDPGKGNLLLSALASGLALGTKATAIVFVPPLLLLQLLSVVRYRKSARLRVADSLTLVLVPFMVSGWFYGRNAWLTGNPLYPLHFEAFGRVILPGWYGRDVMAQSQYFIPFNNFGAFGDILLTVFDPRLAPFWMLGLLGAWAIGTKRNGGSRWVFALSVLAVFNILLYWVAIPYRTQQRFMLHGVGLAVVPLACLISRGRWLRVAAVGLLILHLTTDQSWPFDPTKLPWDFSPLIPSQIGPLFSLPRGSWRLIFTLCLGIASLGLAWSWFRCVGGAGRAAKRWLPLTLSGLAWLGLMTTAIYPWGLDARFQFFPIFPDYVRGWIETDLRSGASGVRLAYAGNALPYYLMGVGLRNEVRYVNVDAHRDWRLHDYHLEAARQGSPTWNHPRPGWDRIHPDYDAWLANLRADGIQLLVVNRANPDEGPHNIADREGFPIERQWAESHPEIFEPLYGVAERDPQFRLYRIRSNGGF